MARMVLPTCPRAIWSLPLDDSSSEDCSEHFQLDPSTHAYAYPCNASHILWVSLCVSPAQDVLQSIHTSLDLHQLLVVVL